LTIIVGNAILWFIRFAIIFASFEKRMSTLDLSREYFGKAGSYFIAILLLVSTFAWFIAQTTAASNTLTHLIAFKENSQIDKFIQVSVLLGFVSTMLSMNGIVLLRKLSTIAFPILLIAFLSILYWLPHTPMHNGQTLSLTGLTLVLATNLGITADMPTFFRHSNSWRDSIIALTAVQLLVLAFSLGSLYFGSIINGLFEIKEDYILQLDNRFLTFSLIVFVFISSVSANVANVYSASVGWEILAPKALVGRTEYLILGLGLTILFIFLSNIFSPITLLSISDFGLVNLCLMVIFGFLISLRLKKPPNLYQQTVYFLTWAIATAANSFQTLSDRDLSLSPLFISVLLMIASSALFIFAAPALRNRRLRRD
jgi:purine-cytosine permease-like protein